MRKEHLYTLIGAAAFIVGGIVARQKALETAEIVEDFFDKKSHKKSEELEAPSADQ